jgi:hypothetical protein
MSILIKTTNVQNSYKITGHQHGSVTGHINHHINENDLQTTIQLAVKTADKSNRVCHCIYE